MELNRTFSVLQKETGSTEDHDWELYFGFERGTLTWADLLDKPLCVVVGEAGIGKTCEFKNEVTRLSKNGSSAFFVELNQLVDLDSWELVLTGHEQEYARWLASNDLAYFFFDAVDEARLKGQPDFERALTVVRKALGPNLARVHIYISSRWTDWSLEGVQAALISRIAMPLDVARRASKVQPATRTLADSGILDFNLPNGHEPLEPFAVSLDSLSKDEAKRFADALKVEAAVAFWAAVSDGDYDFMATRPLDLRWMVGLWNDKRSLGTYRELIEVNIANRLTDVNESYKTAGAVLSLDQLRAGAEGIAAAAEFSSRYFVATNISSISARNNEISPISALGGWKPDDIARLLASAIFDEATYGRVKFHHRSIREYLAAAWVDKQLMAGVPLHRLLPLFVATPFDEAVLVPSRRAALCWLAAINVEVREWLTRAFPDMLLFEGDPEAWDELSANQAFAAYVKGLISGRRPDWFNGVSEHRRVGRRLQRGMVAGYLADPTIPFYVKSSLLPLVKYARLSDCADIVFAIYRAESSSDRERRLTLDVLGTIATADQREVIKCDLVAGNLKSNELKASALAAVNWPSFDEITLAQVFASTKEEQGYGSGPMGRVVKKDLLSEATASSAELLLSAVLLASPQKQAGRRFGRLVDSEKPEPAWLLNVLPNCFERLLNLLPQTLERYPDICFVAADRIERMRFSGFTGRDVFARLNEAIAKHHALRWGIGLEIASSENLEHSIGRVTWSHDCIVQFGPPDLPELTRLANDEHSQVAARDIWFEVGLKVAFGRLRGRARVLAIRGLRPALCTSSRLEKIAIEYANCREGAKQVRAFNADAGHHTEQDKADLAENRKRFLADLEHIRDATNVANLNRLVCFSYDRGAHKNFTKIDFSAVAKAFGSQIGDALAEGLMRFWKGVTPPNPADFGDGSVPFEALMGLVGLNKYLEDGGAIEALSPADAARAARLCAWELESPPNWFISLARAQRNSVRESLLPWILSEARVLAGANRIRGALEVALRCPTDVRADLLGPLAPMVTDGRIGNPETLRAVVNALRQDRVIDSDKVSTISRNRVIASIDSNGYLADFHWVRIWLEEDCSSAWEWFEAHIVTLGPNAPSEVCAFAQAAGDLKWLRTPVDTHSVYVLRRLHEKLGNYLPLPGDAVSQKEMGNFKHVILEVREAIPRVLVTVRGLTSHRALMGFVAGESGEHERAWMNARVLEHAALEALEIAKFEPSALHAFSLAFATEPSTEGQLYEQAIARLEELRKSVEEGPFSDRDLFPLGIREKYLQRWLAARLWDTQSRRFSIHREEEVDDDNKTDIQLSCPRGNVCIEIKPLDAQRSYTATTLVDTLRTQVVGQYLKGYNSSHGILVLFRLDGKRWDIPDRGKGQPFSVLVDYLQEQANLIKNKSNGIRQLTVFGIDCLPAVNGSHAQYVDA